MNNEEAAQVLNISVSSLKARVHRCRVLLREDYLDQSPGYVDCLQTPEEVIGMFSRPTRPTETPGFLRRPE